MRIYDASRSLLEMVRPKAPRLSASFAFATYALSAAALCIIVYECDLRAVILTKSATGSLFFVCLSIAPFLGLMVAARVAFYALLRANRAGSAFQKARLALGQIVIVVTGAAITFFWCAVQLPTIPAVLAQAVRMRNGPIWHVTVDRKVLIVRGEFSSGIADEVEETLRNNSHIRIVALESPGGDVNEAMRIGRAIRRYGLETGVATQCASACTYAFVAGSERLLLPGGELGFHACKKTVWYVACDNQKYLAYLIESGVEEAFARKALSVDPPDIWYPNTGELFTSRVITRTQPDGSGNRNVNHDAL